MKKHFFLGLAITISLILTGCEYDIPTAPDFVLKTFQEKFPDARGAEWERERGLYKADFYSDGHEKEAWFRKDGSWKRTKTDISVREIPDAVQKTIDSYLDGSRRIDDVDFIEQDTDVRAYYRVELEKFKSEKEIIIRIQPDGVLVTVSINWD